MLFRALIFLILSVSQVLPTWSEEPSELSSRELFNDPFIREFLEKSPLSIDIIDFRLLNEKEIKIIEVFLTDLNLDLRNNHQCRNDEDNNTCFVRSCPTVYENDWDHLLCIFNGSVLEDYSSELAEIDSQLNGPEDISSYLRARIALPPPKGLEGISLFRGVEKKNDKRKTGFIGLGEDLFEQWESEEEFNDLISAVIDSWPLLPSEIETFKESVAECWGVKNFYNPKKGSVTLAFSMDRQGKIDPDSLKSISNTFEDSRSAQNAFQRAKRALMKCGVNGYVLPASKYQHWKMMELTFEQ